MKLNISNKHNRILIYTLVTFTLMSLFQLLTPIMIPSIYETSSNSVWVWLSWSFVYFLVFVTGAFIEFSQTRMKELGKLSLVLLGASLVIGLVPMGIFLVQLSYVNESLSIASLIVLYITILLLQLLILGFFWQIIVISGIEPSEKTQEFASRNLFKFMFFLVSIKDIKKNYLVVKARKKTVSVIYMNQSDDIQIITYASETTENDSIANASLRLLQETDKVIIVNENENETAVEGNVPEGISFSNIKDITYSIKEVTRYE